MTEFRWGSRPVHELLSLLFVFHLICRRGGMQPRQILRLHADPNPVQDQRTDIGKCAEQEPEFGERAEGGVGDVEGAYGPESGVGEDGEGGGLPEGQEVVEVEGFESGETGWERRVSEGGLPGGSGIDGWDA